MSNMRISNTITSNPVPSSNNLDEANNVVQLENSNITDEVIYEPTSQKFTPDLDKIRSMKAENDQRIVNLLLKSTSKTFIKQLGGVRGVLDKLIKGEKIDGVNISITSEDIEKAKVDIAPGGYWSPEKTSDRLLEFAKALSGNDPSQADKLINAVKKGFKEAEKLWGGKLPDISRETYDLTMKKFDEWAKEIKAS